MARIPSGGRDLEQEKADKVFDFAKKVYERSGANIGPRQPMSEDMKRRINEDMDRMGIKDKEIKRDTAEDVARTNAARAYHKGPKAQEAFQSQMKNESPELKAAAREALKKEYKVPRGGGGSGGVSDTRELQLGSDLDPKSMMKREGMKKGGSVKSSASSRGDGIAQRGKTKGRMV